ncbi:uncharacterized protein DS421_10g303390 [Arachis hypogaea]|nr:uncharacterized protein DS421_10g303390 [Arachis hypogaea]
MARQAGNDGDINRLNDTSHYAGVADFEMPRLLLPRRVSHTLPPPNAIVPYLVEARFGDMVPLRDFTFDNSLISTLLERWHPETHMFHLPWGEVTITLQDVAFHLGLRAHGNPVRGAFVASVGGTALRRGRWWSKFLIFPTDNPETLRQYARCYIMLLIRGYLLTDKSNNLVHLRWIPLLRDFEECRRGVTGITRCTPLLMSSIYQRFFQWYLPDRRVYQYPLAARLVGLQQQSICLC